MRLFHIGGGSIQRRCHGGVERALCLRHAEIGGTRQRKKLVDFQLCERSGSGSITDDGIYGRLRSRGVIRILQITLGETLWHNRNQINIIRCDSLLQRYGIVINGDHLTVQSEVGTQRLSHMLGVVITVDYRNTGGFRLIRRRSGSCGATHDLPADGKHHRADQHQVDNHIQFARFENTQCCFTSVHSVASSTERSPYQDRPSSSQPIRPPWQRTGGNCRNTECRRTDS